MKQTWMTTTLLLTSRYSETVTALIKFERGRQSHILLRPLLFYYLVFYNYKCHTVQPQVIITKYDLYKL